MTPRIPTPTLLPGLLALALLLPLGGCDPYEPEMVPVANQLSLYSLARAEYIGRASAVDFSQLPRAVVIEQAQPSSQTAFDIAFSELDGRFVFLPAGLFDGYEVRPGIYQETVLTFDELERAPSDGYVTDAAVPVAEGDVLVIRSRERGTCTRYAKLEVQELDPEGLIEFRYFWNNLCNDRDIANPNVED